MIAKKRGRPSSPTRQRQQPLQPPDYIHARIISRRSKPNQHWSDALQNMEEYQKLITAYRRKFRIKESVALTLIVSLNEAVKQDALNEALSSVKGWKKVSDAGLRARGYETPKWHEFVRALMKTQHARCSARRVAQIVQENEIRNNKIPPHERSIRRFIKTLKI